MILELKKTNEALNKAYLKEKVSRNHIELFKKNLQQLLYRINEEESEEHLKNVIADFLKDTWYKDQFEINTKNSNDLVIHSGKTTKEPVAVILETKKPSNKSEMMTVAKPNSKALQELVLYYLRERIDHNNTEIRYLIVTNIYEWYIVDEIWFEKNIFRSSKLKKDYENWKLGGKDTKFFYNSIAKVFLDEVTDVMQAVYFDIRSYEIYVNNQNKIDDSKLIGLYKILSPAHLLKQPFINDSNSLDTKFYTELLHIVGLEEVKCGTKKLIKRKTNADEASLLENTIIKLEDRDSLRSISNLAAYGTNRDDQLFNVALELCITWINRVLFIKLLEAQLYKYHKGDKQILFLNSKIIFDFDELSNLFFQVLAEKTEYRRSYLQEKFNKVPYLNSSLFERIELERQALNISELDNRLQLPLSITTVLKDGKGKRKLGSLPTLQYLFEFLDAYDFTSEGGEEIQEENKNLINASVLGLIFEKINGYKDGSFFTPGFVTMYMCKEAIRKSVLQKFNEVKGWHCDTLDFLYNKIDDKNEANRIINSLHICDPAVGSGHFLVSVLNEIIAIKSELKILQDTYGKSLRDYHVEVVNDELIITGEDGKLFDYNPQNKESQRVQETIFHEKEIIIENCLFGVDINPNSVKICRLRLWIELLKSAYYTSRSNYVELETLPNIDINIKCGNSLISRFAIDADIKEALNNKQKWNIESYKIAVQAYRVAENKGQKRLMEELIDNIKSDFRSEISPNDPKFKRLSKLRGDLFNLSQTNELFDEGIKKNKDNIRQTIKLRYEIEKLEKDVDEIKYNKIYENAFEWRFEFPEVLNSEGDFTGFDVVIGNPPYGIKEKGKKYLNFVQQYYPIARKVPDSYMLFMIRGNELAKKMGAISYIVPNTFCDIEQGFEFREWFLLSNSLTKLYDSSWVFQDAIVDTLVYFQIKQKPTTDEIIIISNDFTEKKISLSQIKDNDGYKIDFRATQGNKSLLKKIENGSRKLSSLATIKAGAKLYEKGKGSPKQSQDVVDSKPFTIMGQKPKGWYGLIRGSDINKYSLKPINEFVSYGEWLAAPRDTALFSGDRIIIRRTDDTIRATFIDSDSICANSCHVLTPNDKGQTKILLAILNSKLMQWVFEQKNPQMVGKAFAEIKVVYVESLPIKLSSNTKDLELLVNEILEVKNANPNNEIALQVKTIDNIVYKIYDLSPEEIKLIEKDLPLDP